MPVILNNLGCLILSSLISSKGKTYFRTSVDLCTERRFKPHSSLEPICVDWIWMIGPNMFAQVRFRTQSASIAVDASCRLNDRIERDKLRE